MRKQTLRGLAWTYMERVGTQVVSFIVSIILARVLMPHDYGVIAIVLVFIHVCDVFVQSGMGMALVQKKDVNEKDFSSVFWLSLFISIALYLLLFILAPLIADFYTMPILCPLLQVLGLRLPLASFNTVQRAIVSRNMRFKAYFYASIVGVLFSAIVGILMALEGYGVWALVWQQISNSIVGTIIVACFVKWHPAFVYSGTHVRTLFGFGWKVLVGGLIDVFYEDFRSLYVGKLYTPADLAYYTRGKQFPNLIVRNVNSSISTVLFPALSKMQDDVATVASMTRRAIKISSFLMMPCMFGLAAISKPLVLLKKTKKWLPCVPFVQILCINSAIMPLQTANLQAIYAVGRSDIAMKLNMIKKAFGFIIILVSATFSVLAMAWGGVLVGVFASMVNAAPNKRLLGYNYLTQLKDILPSVIISAVMCVVIFVCERFPIFTEVMLLLQVFVGFTIYILLSYFFNRETLTYIKDNIFLNRVK